MKALIRRLMIFAAILVAVLAIGTISFSLIEGLSLFNAFYFTLVTVATVGYGDIHPITTAGKILAMIIIVFGVGTFTGAIVNTIGFFIERRQHEERKERINTLIELFFSEVGNTLLAKLAAVDPEIGEIRTVAKVDANWTDSDFANLKAIVEEHKYSLDKNSIAFEQICDFLGDKHDILIRLLESPILLEHEIFTDLLKATFHLREELMARPNLAALTENDAKHLTVDAVRVYALLAKRWINYMQELKKRYPYLFSFSQRTNPFSENRSPVVM
jgi:voltage-gated potassium channel